MIDDVPLPDTGIPDDVNGSPIASYSATVGDVRSAMYLYLTRFHDVTSCSVPEDESQKVRPLSVDYSELTFITQPVESGIEFIGERQSERATFLRSLLENGAGLAVLATSTNPEFEKTEYLVVIESENSSDFGFARPDWHVGGLVHIIEDLNPVADFPCGFGNPQYSCPVASGANPDGACPEVTCICLISESFSCTPCGAAPSCGPCCDGGSVGVDPATSIPGWACPGAYDEQWTNPRPVTSVAPFSTF